MDAITILKNDHKTVQRMFREFEKAHKQKDSRKRSSLADSIIEELTTHTAIEEQVFYPAVRKEVEGSDDQILEAFEEHHVAKQLIEELKRMTPDNERFDAKVGVLIESVRHHVKEEEGELFPSVRDSLGRKRLGEIGEQLEVAKSKL